ncbi:MAG: isoleucyl-tRNA synthetase [uncultured Acidilobus sp. MG]|nr:MAG: isoleucyl-tRNA synthetase [uncultured Acidilobus sp. MG]
MGKEPINAHILPALKGEVSNKVSAMKIVGNVAAEANKDLHELEGEILEFWDRNSIYEKVKAKAMKSGRKLYFLDGPPYASAPTIHVGTAWNKILKDSLLRYYRMVGFDVWDKPGFDTHGLPIEILVERTLNVKSKKDIEDVIGIDRFVETCRKVAEDNIKGMTESFRQLGVFMDWKDPYITYTDDYIEAGWHLIKRVHELGLLYRSGRVLHWCPRCETTLADYEVSEYVDLEDPSIYVKFRVKGQENVYLVIWTTTPWTLPANAFVMAHPDLSYAIVEANGEKYIMAEARVPNVMSEAGITNYRIASVVRGKDLEGLEYEHPLEDVVQAQAVLKAYHRVVMAPEAVSATEGTGLVHAAPGHGDVDFEVGSRIGAPAISLVDNQGRMTEQAGKYRGLYFRTEANEAILRDLRERNALLHEGKIVHKYPVCWRCKTPLVLRLTDQWFIAVSKVKDKLIREADTVEWVPSWAKSRLLSILTDVKDWVISRQRYWGIPLPIWVCESCGHVEVVGSVEDLERLGGKRPPSLHRPWIDSVTLRCPKCGGIMKRVPDVADVWFDSGVAFYASLGYPRRKDLFERLMPVDLILEGHDQLRGWFFSLLRVGVLGFDRVPYRRVLVHGFVLDEQGREMHKSLGNYVAFEDLIAKYPRDVVRLYVLRNTTWEDLRFSWRNIELTARDFMIIRNVFAFASLYMSLDGFDPEAVTLESVAGYLEPEDKWLLSRVNSALRGYHRAFDRLEVHEAARIVRDLIVEDISRWYIRLIRRRVWQEEDTPSKRAAYATLYYALRTWLLMAAPLMPFLTEYMYQGLVRPAESGAPESVHLMNMPSPDEKFIDAELEDYMNVIRELSEAAVAARSKAGIKLRRPLRTIYIMPSDERVSAAVKTFTEVLKIATNVKEVKVVGPEFLENLKVYRLEPNYSVLGPDFKKLTKKVIEAISVRQDEVARELLARGYYELDVEGQKVRLEPRHVKVLAKYPEWLEVEETRYGIVALDKRLSEEEQIEGIVREVIRRVQFMRKKLSLPVEAYIDLWISGDDDILQAVKSKEYYLKNEVRAASVTYGEPPAEAYGEEWEVDEKRLKLGLRQREGPRGLS